MNSKAITIILFFLISLSSCKGQKKESTKNNYTYTNSLATETSPYLLQHAHNPVNWYPWGDEAFAKAKKENKMVIISIGYAACHWCHVMEEESFEDTAIAKYMNDNFVCIKVDREERPDVDQIYITAAHIITGSAGWPLNALAMPDGKPFYAATYFPKDQWLDMLKYFKGVQNKTPDLLAKQADQITKGIYEVEEVPFKENAKLTTLTKVKPSVDNWLKIVDYKKGGNTGAPKFPMPSNWSYLMQYNYLTEDKDALTAVTTTLEKMANGGIFDQLQGGFSRYSTDENWIAPHFEKMLYDNAQLVSLYSNAFKKTKNPLYKEVVEKTLSFIQTELTDPNGGFYSSLDADSEGEEGKYYVWKSEEIKQILGENAPLFMDYYQVTDKGNWEHGNNILYRNNKESKLLKEYNLTQKKLHEQLTKDRAKLLEIRTKRIKPRLDDKIITAWNALMINGYLDAYQAFGDENYKEKALISANFIYKNLQQNDKEVLRNYKNKKANIHGLLDDYAFLISAYIKVYQTTFDETWLYRAKELNEYVFEHFYDEKNNLFFYTHNKFNTLIVRKKEIADNVIPSSNSQMAENIYYLGLYFDDANYKKIATQMVLNVSVNIANNIQFYSNWASVELLLIKPPYEIAIVGNDAENKRKEIQKNYLPNSIFLGGKTEGTLSLLEGKLTKNATRIFVCQNKSCQLPTEKIEVALTQIKN